MFSKMVQKLGKPIPKYFINHSQDRIKDRSLVADEDVMQEFIDTYVKDESARYVSTLKLEVNEKKLITHKLQLNQKHVGHKKPKAKKAIVYMMGNVNYVAETLPELEPVLKNIIEESHKAGLRADYALFCQDYRGKGFNKRHYKENFNDYPVSQDVEDQTGLIVKLVEDEGYKPEDILILGYSYGSAIALWSIYDLIHNVDAKYENIKIICDRGYSNFFDYPYVKPFVVDQNKAQHKLHQKGVMPDLFLHDIAGQLTETFVTSVAHDHITQMHISLLGKMDQEKMPGRVWTLDVDKNAKTIPHLATHSFIHSQTINELQAHHFITAILNETPINLKLKLYSIKDDQDIHDDKKHKKTAKKKLKEPCISISANTISTLIIQLYEYFEKQSEKISDNSFISSLKQTSSHHWTAKDKLLMSQDLMVPLLKEGGPDINAIRLLQKTDGPHHSGKLGKIFNKLTQFIDDYEKLHLFNTWVSEMRQRRKLRKQNGEDSVVKQKKYNMKSLSFFSPVTSFSSQAFSEESSTISCNSMHTYNERHNTFKK